MYYYDLLNLVYRFVCEFILFSANDVVSEHVIIPRNPPTAIRSKSVSFSKKSNDDNELEYIKKYLFSMSDGQLLVGDIINIIFVFPIFFPNKLINDKQSNTQ